MEIWLLLTVAGMVSSTPHIIIVNETPNRKVILEGSTVVLHCHLWPDTSERCRVSWFFNHSSPFKSSHWNLSNQLNVTLTLDNVSQNQSGWYSCEARIEIPSLKYKHSNWTELVINKRLLENRPTTYRPRSTSQTGVIEKVSEKPHEKLRFEWSDLWRWIAVGISGLVLVILLVVCLVWRKKQLNGRELENTVYANMPAGSRQPSPQPRPGNCNTLKTESTYQNLRTPDVNKRYEHSRRLSPNRF